MRDVSALSSMTFTALHRISDELLDCIKVSVYPKIDNFAKF